MKFVLVVAKLGYWVHIPSFEATHLRAYSLIKFILLSWGYYVGLTIALPITIKVITEICCFITT